MGDQSGFLFPFSLDPATGKIQMSSEDRDIRDSVYLLLRTEKGERVMRPEFGVRLDRFTFERIDNTTENLIRQEVISAILEWEDRVENITVNFDSQEANGTLLVRVGYQVKKNGLAEQVDITLPRE